MYLPRLKLAVCAVGIFAILITIAPPALAATTGTGSLRLSGDTFPDFTFQIPLSTTMTRIDGEEMVNGTAIATYISTIYQWGVAFAAVLAVLAFTYAGVLWLIAGGDSGKVTESKKVMSNSLVGLSLALGSYLLLWMVKPELIQFAPITVTPIEEISSSFNASGPAEPGKPTGFVTADLPDDPCDPTAFSNSRFSFLFGSPVYALPTSTDPCVYTKDALRQFGLPKATKSDVIAKGIGKDAQLWDIKNLGVKDGIVRAANKLEEKHRTGYDYEGLIGMWAAHEMQFNQFASECASRNGRKLDDTHIPLNSDCDWGNGENYQVGLGVHTAQIEYLEEAFQQMEHGTDKYNVIAVAQRVINRSGKGGHASIRPEYIALSDIKDVTSLRDLIKKAKDGDIKSRRAVITLMRDPGIGAYLIGKHLTKDFTPSKLATIMNSPGWGGGYPPQLMSNLFATWYRLKKLAS